ncbi:hypothetical protein [Hymenobacter properus]|jgi:hypothetical protein|uniref:Uncharacterized protein n=1 Tax=Hymenobacter properus TaxID=2791026 RepID=A0A931BI76_9BACT|nr:hypothetical protein [Hymenobacter properus]MBF9144380.1 hypothetical protein [Hymenobacter properus]MBR7723198.1 hypothetical protein [Microvirga sp. SRT04]
MKDNYDLPNEDEFDENQPHDSEKQESDAQELDFLARLKRLSDDAQEEAEGRQGAFAFSPEEEGQDEPFGAEFAGDQHNQKESYDLNYAIRRLLMQGLPRGEENKDLRQMVYDEKNLLLRDGVDRPAGGGTIGADSRQAKPSLARAAYVKTQAWADRGGSAYDIFLEYYDLNKQMRFR